jgi:exonuclease VII small subunit
MADFEHLVAMIEQIIGKMGAHQERLEANMNAWQNECLLRSDGGLSRKDVG